MALSSSLRSISEKRKQRRTGGVARRGGKTANGTGPVYASPASMITMTYELYANIHPLLLVETSERLLDRSKLRLHLRASKACNFLLKWAKAAKSLSRTYPPM